MKSVLWFTKNHNNCVSILFSEIYQTHAFYTICKCCKVKNVTNTRSLLLKSINKKNKCETQWELRCEINPNIKRRTSSYWMWCVESILTVRKQSKRFKDWYIFYMCIKCKNISASVSFLALIKFIMQNLFNLKIS